MVDAAYFRDRKNKRRQFFIDMLGGKCAICGSKKNLHFDHLKPSEKEYTISRILTFPIDFVTKEVNKCQLLCSKCHHKKTLENEEYGALAPHGSLWRYKHYGCRCDLCRKARSDYYYSKLSDG